MKPKAWGGLAIALLLAGCARGPKPDTDAIRDGDVIRECHDGGMVVREPDSRLLGVHLIDGRIVTDWLPSTATAEGYCA